MQHGLRGPADLLSTRVPDPVSEPVQPTSEPFEEPVEDIPEENQENHSGESQIFFTTETEASEPDEVYLTIIPRSRHNEPDSISAKEKELEHFETFDVYEEVEKPKEGNVISTQWVIVEKETEDGKVVRKARCCMRGDKEKDKHLIPTDSPTVNKNCFETDVNTRCHQGVGNKMLRHKQGLSADRKYQQGCICDSTQRSQSTSR